MSRMYILRSMLKLHASLLGILSQTPFSLAQLAKSHATRNLNNANPPRSRTSSLSWHSLDIRLPSSPTGPSTLLSRTLLHQVRQTQVLPSRLFGLLGGSLNTKRRMLIRNYIVFIFRIDGLVVRWNVDFIVWKFVFAKVFEEIRVSRTVEVDISVV